MDVNNAMECGHNKISFDKKYMGMDTVTLENEALMVMVIPEYGGKVQCIIEKSNGFQYLWQNERTIGRKPYYGADFDNLQCGGIDEAFPCVLPANYRGESFPFFGELWSMPWTYEVYSLNENSLTLRLECFCSIYPVKAEKCITLYTDNILEIRYRFYNLSHSQLEYIFGVHPSLSIMADCTITVPDGTYFVNYASHDLFNGHELKVGHNFTWPNLCDTDLRYAMSQDRNFCVNIVGEHQGFKQLSVGYPSLQRNITMSYDGDLLKYLSLWLIYGGWRGHYCIMAEPFTSWPLNLDKAADSCNAAHLMPKGDISTCVRYSIE